jgi:GTP cyclohydrolase IA
MQTVTIEQFQRLSGHLRERIGSLFTQRPVKIWGVPSGGIPVAAAIADGRIAVMVDRIEDCDVVVDDLIDSGATMDQIAKLFPQKPFMALIDKRDWDHGDQWVVWPWESTAEKGIEDHIRRLIQYAGDDPTRGGLLETPARVAKAWRFWCSGYEQDPASVLKTFEDGAEGVDEMVVVKDIPFYTHCEHHMAPFFGTATIAYLPDGKVVGLSKLSRLLKVFARRLQVQERLTCQVADALMQHLTPLGCGVVIKARHMCMESRGVCEQGHHTVTSALRGVFKDDPAVRSEFLALAR